MNLLSEDRTEASGSSSGAKCKVAILYEDTPSRERAVHLTHRLIDRFWSEIDFDFSWWRFRYLQDEGISDAALRAAAMADVIVFSLSADQPLPPEVDGWGELLVAQGMNAAAVIVPLLDPSTVDALTAAPSMSALAELARRTGRDLLLPAELEGDLFYSETARRLHRRATKVTQTLDDILHHWGKPPSPPAHWGLNE